MKKLKRIYIFIKMKLQGYSEETIYTSLVFKHLMSFEEYEKFFDKKIKERFNSILRSDEVGKTN